MRPQKCKQIHFMLAATWQRLAHAKESRTRQNLRWNNSNFGLHQSHPGEWHKHEARNQLQTASSCLESKVHRVVARCHTWEAALTQDHPLSCRDSSSICATHRFAAPTLDWDLPELLQEFQICPQVGDTLTRVKAVCYTKKEPASQKREQYYNKIVTRCCAT